MCFSQPKQPPPQAPPPPPTARDANQDALRVRADQAKRARMSGLDANMTSGTGGVLDPVTGLKPTLGA